VRGVVDGLKSVFMNLINNAVQAIDGPGGCSIIAENLVGEHMVRIRVSDSGPGIPPALREKIFAPFFTTKAQNKSGTGLGLAIVRNVVRDHGGSVSAWARDPKAVPASTSGCPRQSSPGNAMNVPSGPLSKPRRRRPSRCSSSTTTS
jgi:nitrogen-specific signal transduction histidine kinase